MAASYEIEARNKVRQIRKFADYDKETVFKILDAGLVAHAAFVQDDEPVVVPMIYGRDGETLYLHGARKARIIRMLEGTERACVNVTLVDGLLLARSTFNSAVNYRSVTVFGKPSLVDDHTEKLRAVRVISEHTLPGRWDEVRESHEREVKMTGVIALQIETGSAKIADGMPDDEEEDYETPVWAGLIPITLSTGQLQDDDRLLPEVEPSEVVKAMQNKVY